MRLLEVSAKNRYDSVHGLDTVDHGGHCCGMSHLTNFPVTSDEPRLKELTDEKRVELIIQAMQNAEGFEYDDCCCDVGCEECEKDREAHNQSYHHCFEVAIIPRQVTEWGSALERAGFTEVYKFLNSNTGNTVHVYLCETNRLRSVK